MYIAMWVGFIPARYLSGFVGGILGVNHAKLETIKLAGGATGLFISIVVSYAFFRFGVRKFIVGKFTEGQ